MPARAIHVLHGPTAFVGFMILTRRGQTLTGSTNGSTSMISLSLKVMSGSSCLRSLVSSSQSTSVVQRSMAITIGSQSTTTSARSTLERTPIRSTDDEGPCRLCPRISMTPAGVIELLRRSGRCTRCRGRVALADAPSKCYWPTNGGSHAPPMWRGHARSDRAAVHVAEHQLAAEMPLECGPRLLVERHLAPVAALSAYRTCRDRAAAARTRA